MRFQESRKRSLTSFSLFYLQECLPLELFKGPFNMFKKKKKQASTWKKQCSQAWITWDPRRTSPEHLYIEPKTRVLQDTFSYGGTYRHWFLGQATTWKEQCWFQQKGFIKTVGTIQMVFISERLLPKASGARKTWCRAPQSCDSGWSWVLYKNLTRLLVQKEQQLTICGRTIGSEQRKY